MIESYDLFSVLCIATDLTHISTDGDDIQVEEHPKVLAPPPYSPHRLHICVIFGIILNIGQF